MQVGQADRPCYLRAFAGQRSFHISNDAIHNAAPFNHFPSLHIMCSWSICSTASIDSFDHLSLSPSHHRCISALTSNHTASSLVEASQGILPPDDAAQWGGGSCLLPLLEQLTLALVAAGGVGVCDEEPWLHDCMEMMLEVRCTCRTDLLHTRNVEFLMVSFHL